MKLWAVFADILMQQRLAVPSLAGHASGRARAASRRELSNLQSCRTYMREWYRSLLRFHTCFASKQALPCVAVRDGWRRAGRHPSRVMPTSGPRAWQIDRRTSTSMAASSRRSAAAREAEEGLAAAVRCTSALGDALLLAVGAAHTCAVLLQRRQLQPRRLASDFIAVHAVGQCKRSATWCC